jgi:predicted RNA polymerase sigma factor
MAVAMADGPAAGLALIDDLEDDNALVEYHYVAAARAELLERLGRGADAADAFERAAARAPTPREAATLLARAARLRVSTDA